MEETRHEILARHWQCTVEEAKARDEKHLAGVAADAAAAEEAGKEAEASPVKKSKASPGDVAAKTDAST